MLQISCVDEYPYHPIELYARARAGASPGGRRPDALSRTTYDNMRSPFFEELREEANEAREVADKWRGSSSS